MWKILLVDDDESNRKLIREILSGKAECFETQNGKEALSAFVQSIKSKDRFDMILLDVAMPDMDGITVLKNIRQIEEDQGVRFGQGVPVIMVTAFTAPFMSSFKEGADDYILKPVDPDELITKIEKRLHKSTK